MKCEVCQRETFPNGKDGYQHNLCFSAVMPERECYRLGYERVTAEKDRAENYRLGYVAALERARVHQKWARKWKAYAKSWF